MPYLTLGLIAAFALFLVVFVPVYIYLTRIYSYEVIYDVPTPNKGPQSTSKTFGLLRGLGRYWRAHGAFVATRPILVIILAVIVASLCSLGILRLEIDSNPETLWVRPSFPTPRHSHFLIFLSQVPPDSRAALDKNYFDSHFGPFYRIEMLIITRSEGNNDTVHHPRALLVRS